MDSTLTRSPPTAAASAARSVVVVTTRNAAEAGAAEIAPAGAIAIAAAMISRPRIRTGIT